MRATSKRLCFIASIARSNKTLSGCFDPTLAKGLTDFLLVQATVIASNRPSTGMIELRRDIRTSKWLMWGQPPSAVHRAKLGFFIWPPPLDLQQRRFRRRLQQPLCILLWIPATEHGVARHQNFRARPHRIAHCIERYAAIYFDAVVQPALAANLS